MKKLREERSYILTMPTRGTQTVLVTAATAKEAIEKWYAHEEDFWRADHEINWTGVPRAIVDGGWIKKEKAKPLKVGAPPVCGKCFRLHHVGMKCHKTSEST